VVGRRLNIRQYTTVHAGLVYSGSLSCEKIFPNIGMSIV